MPGDNNNKGGNEFVIITSYSTKANGIVIFIRMDGVDISVWSKRSYGLKKAAKLARPCSVEGHCGVE